MKKPLHFLGFILLLFLPAIAHARNAAVQKTASPEGPLLFMENRGQIADMQGHARPDVLFSAHGGSIQVFLTANAIHYQFSRTIYPEGFERKERWAKDAARQQQLRRQIRTETQHFTLSLAGANPHPRIRTAGKSSYRENYYLPQRPQGITAVAAYGKVTLENVYPGIDWVIYSNGKGLKYDFVVQPGAAPSQIALSVKDAAVNILSDGAMAMETGMGMVKEAPPVSFCGARQPKTKFVRTSKGLIGFEVAPYNKEQVLTIDPSIAWATYYGGGQNDLSNGCTTDADGNVYMVGYTSSTSNIAAGGFQNALYGLTDAMVVKFSPTGQRLWATYYGGGAEDGAADAATDANGNLYISGTTTSSNVIGFNGHQNAKSGEEDAFLAKFSPAGIRIWSTYYGAGNYERGEGVTVDPSGNVYLSGYSSSPGGLASGGFQNAMGGTNNVFLVKFTPGGTRLWATYYGGPGFTTFSQCAADHLGNVYLTGTTDSPTGISSGGFQNSYSGGPDDIFLAKFDAAGNRLWATYIGGPDQDVYPDCTVDINNNVFVAGSTASQSNIAFNAFQSSFNYGPWEAMLVKLSPTGFRYWSTYYGGTGQEQGITCTTDPSGNVYLAGSTSSTTNIANGGFKNAKSGPSYSTDAFLAKFNTNGQREWGTYYGGDGDESNWTHCTADPFGSVYITGMTGSSNGIAYGNAHQGSFGGYLDGFLVKVNDTLFILTDTIRGPFCAGDSLNIPFKAYGAFQPGNVFSAQLADANGSFNVPQTIGSLPGIGSGTIRGRIPVSTPAGTGYRIRVVSSLPPVTGTDNRIDIQINTRPPMPGPIAGDTSVCSGSVNTYRIAPVAGADSYFWELPAGWSGNSSGTSITATAGNTDGFIKVTARNACGDSPPHLLYVHAGTGIILVPSAQITASANPACADAVVTFIASVSNSGNAPSYQWLKNGSIVGTNSPIYASGQLATGDEIQVVMTSTSACVVVPEARSNTIRMTILPAVVPGININTIPPSVLCAGTTIHFITNNNGAGNAPQYQWYKNGQLLPGATQYDYSTNVLADRDTLQVKMRSSATCPTVPEVWSNKLGLTVNAIVRPAVTVSVSPGTTVSPGQSVTFTASILNGGSLPGYQWLKNGTAIAGATNASYTTNTLRDGDVIELQLAGNAPCSEPAVVRSTPVTMHIPNGVNSVTGKNGSIRIYPNPSSGRFTISSTAAIAQSIRITLTNALGQQVYDAVFDTKAGAWSKDVDLDPAMASGIYLLQLSGGAERVSAPISISR